MLHPYTGSIRQIQLCERLFTESQFILRKEGFVIHNVKDGNHGCSVVYLVYLDLAQSLKAFTAIDRAVTVQVGDVLPVGINTDLAKF